MKQKVHNISLYLIRFLSRFLIPGDPRVNYKQQGLESNYVDKCYYPISYLLTCDDNNRKRHFQIGKDTNFHIHIDTDK